jgi:hypothetical protein
VLIENNELDPAISISDVTDVNGYYKIVNAEPGTEAYEITVGGGDYSTEQTYTTGEPANPNPDKPHANVVEGLVTQISFSIDELSDIDVTTSRSDCSTVGNVDFQMTGSKTIGESILKYDQSHTTSGGGSLDLNDIEWDTYEIDITDGTYFLAGSNPIVPFDLSPGITQDLDLIMDAQNPNGFLISVTDGPSGLPIADATVSIDGPGGLQELITGNGFITQTDWSGGDGQSDFINADQFFSQDGNIDYFNISGQVELDQFAGSYLSDAELTSSTFDTGAITNFHTIEWEPASQPGAAGADSVRFQIATSETNDEFTVWNFIGPDGTNSSYYTTSGENIHSSHDNDQYLRYRLLLSTDDTSVTPTVSDFSFTYSTDCIPSGQVYFDGLSDGDYDISVTKTGYSDFIFDNYDLSEDWQSLEVILNP